MTTTHLLDLQDLQSLAEAAYSDFLIQYDNNCDSVATAVTYQCYVDLTQQVSDFDFINRQWNSVPF